MLNYIINFLYKIGSYKSLFSVLTFNQAVNLMLLDFLKKTKTLNITINGINLLIRSNTSDYLVAKESLISDEYDCIELEAPKIIIDLGANIGTSALALHRRYPESKIYAVEMENENFQLLKENVSAYKNIIPIHAAIAGTSGTRKIFDRGTGPWGYTITDTINEKSELSEKIQAISLDELVEKYAINRINLLKIDIEGAEKEIFETENKWLTITDVIIAELHDRIVMGATRTFYLSTSSFTSFDIHGEKVIAYR
ncbi:FkbM family methyltransferase [Methylobacter psychrophilus]|uniref:FkbM family methyltransferase n=1 Tax=Methylobacter psychrophilus TaxID=96941 RepID=UPI0021D48B9D|nr:FkbM family methyltransferase [Methylobacter psychrophilus]